MAKDFSCLWIETKNILDTKEENNKKYFGLKSKQDKHMGSIYFEINMAWRLVCGSGCTGRGRENAFGAF